MSFYEDLMEEERRQGVARQAPIDDPNKGLGFWPRWNASFMDTPEARARKMQGTMPTAEFRTFDEGIGYRPEGEQDFYLAEPSGWKSTGLGILADMTGGGVPAEIGATAGSFFGPGGAVAGAGIGEGIMQAIQAGLEPSERSVMDAGGDVLMSAGGAAAGEGLGKLGRHMMRRRMPLEVRDRDMTDRLIESSREFDVPLTPAEATKNRDLLVAQSWLHDNPRTGDAVDKFLEERSAKIEDAVNSYFAELSPYGNPHRVDEFVAREATALRNQMVDERRLAASPYYQRAAGDVVDVTDVVDDLGVRLQDYPDGHPVKSALTKARRMMLQETEDGLSPINTIGRLHNVKTFLDDRIGRAKRAGENNMARELFEVKENLLGFMDDASPAYNLARQEFAAESMPINEYDMSILGSAVLKEDGFSTGPASRLSEKIFHKNSSPYEIQYAKDMLSERSPEAWDAVVRSHLQRTFDELTEGMSTNVDNIGGQFRKAIFGNERKRAQLKHALGPQRYKRLERLMEVLEATGLGLRGQSQTQPRQALARGVERAAEPFGSVGFFTSPFSWVREAMKESRLDQLYENLVRVAVSDSTQADFAIDRALKEIRKYGGKLSAQRTPGTQALFNYLVQSGVQSAQ